jgi:hypothetical protein
MRQIRFLLAALIFPATALSLEGQQREMLTGVDATFGLARGLGGPRANERSMTSFGVTAAMPVFQNRHGLLMVGLHGSRNGHWQGYGCTLDTPLEQCYGYPNDRFLSLMGGWAVTSGRLSTFRAMIGPSVVETSEARRGAGLVARLDAARNLDKQVSGVVWTQFHTLPSRNGAFLTVLSLGVGLRVHRDAKPAR